MYKVPGWQYMSLSEVTVQWLFGQTLPRSRKEYYSGTGEGIPWVKAEDIHGGLLTETKECIAYSGRDYVRTIQPGAVLLSTAGTIGKVAIAGVEVTCNQAVQAMLFHPDQVLAKFGYYYLMFQAPQLNHLANGVTVPNLTQSALKNFPIGFPSLEEQKRLVSILQLAEHAVFLKQKEETLLDRYLAAIFSREIRKENATPENVTLQELLIQPLQRGLRLKQSERETGYVLLNGFGENRYLCDDLAFCLPVQPNERQKNRYQVRPGDILIRFAPKSSPQMLIAGKWGDSIPLLGANLIQLRPDGRRILPEYLYLYLTLLFQGQAKNGALTDRSIDWNQLMVPVLPMKTQRLIRKKFYDLITVKDWILKTRKKAESLFTGLLQRVFLGLWPRPANWSADLLKEIYPYLKIRTPDKSKRLEQLVNLPAPLKSFLHALSPLQLEILERLVEHDAPQAAHVLFREIQKMHRYDVHFQQYSVQDVFNTMNLLEQFGLLEGEVSNIPNPFSSSLEAFMDHNNKPVQIRLYHLTPELLKEDENETETGLDKRL